MNTTNYLQNRLFIKYLADKAIIIPEEAWSETRQNLKHVQIFSNRVSIHIPIEKRS